MTEKRRRSHDHKSRKLRALPTGDHLNGLKSKFETYENSVTTAPSRRRPDLEKYALAAIAIGRYPDNPPQWAVAACVKAYEIEAKQAGAFLNNRRTDILADQLEAVLLRIAHAHEDNLSLLLKDTSDGHQVIIDNPTKITFLRRDANGDNQEYSFASAVKEMLKQAGEPYDEDANQKRSIQKRWRELTPEERLALTERCRQTYFFEKHGFDTLHPHG